jgi:hypothetical protein
LLLQVFLERDVQKEFEEFIQNLFMEEYDLIQVRAYLNMNIMYSLLHFLIVCVIINLKQLLYSSIMRELTRDQARLYDKMTTSPSD